MLRTQEDVARVAAEALEDDRQFWRGRSNARPGGTRPRSRRRSPGVLAARYADQGVTGFGLSFDERFGRVADFAPAAAIAADAGLMVVPHAGSYEPAWHVAQCVRLLRADRIGHGITAVHDPAVLELLAERGVTIELCPTSYPRLGWPGR